MYQARCAALLFQYRADPRPVLTRGVVMAENNEGDWGGDNLPLFIREHIREVDIAIESLVSSVAQLRTAVAGVAVGAVIGQELSAQR
jgi:hypothetical protein